MSEVGAAGGVDFSLPKLVEVLKEFDDVGPTAAGQRERRLVVLEVLQEGVPVPPLLRLVAARRSGRC